MRSVILSILVFFVIPVLAIAQNDSILFKNENLIIGEIKGMDKGVLTIETPYSNTDFKVDWKEIRRISSRVNYLITISSGRRYNGSLNSISDSTVLIHTYIPPQVIKFSSKNEKLADAGASSVEVPIDEIVYLNSLDEGFWSRLSLFFDIGLNLTKSNNFKQYTLNTGVGYLADRWKGNLSFNNLRSSQNETDPIRRTEIAFGFNYFLPRDWFLLYNLNMLSNTEQLIDLRTSNMAGIGKYFIHTNQTYLAFQTGVNLNNEKFSNVEQASQSGEYFFGAQYNIYDIGDLDILSTAAAYPSLSTKGRFRSDFKLDLRYEFKFDLYFKVSSSINFDNMPTVGASKTDYIFQTTVGWKL